MDNPQLYQPLSHALHPPHPPTPQAKPPYTVRNQHFNSANHASEGEEEDDEDEGIVEQQLNDTNLNDHDATTNLPPHSQLSACVHSSRPRLLTPPSDRSTAL